MARPRRQIAEGADGLLPGPLGCAQGFDQDMVGVGLLLVAPCGLSPVHDHYIRDIILAIGNEIP